MLAPLSLTLWLRAQQFGRSLPRAESLSQLGLTDICKRLRVLYREPEAHRQLWPPLVWPVRQKTRRTLYIATGSIYLTKAFDWLNRGPSAIHSVFVFWVLKYYLASDYACLWKRSSHSRFFAFSCNRIHRPSHNKKVPSVLVVFYNHKKAVYWVVLAWFFKQTIP